MSSDLPPKRRSKSVISWPLVRKLESLAFMAMFLAVPFFGYRVVEYTSHHLALNNAAHDLVKDIRRVKQMSAEYQMEITIESKPQSDGHPAAYVISSGDKTIEEVVLPQGVSMIGKITFSRRGMPELPSTFDVHMDTRSISVDVDSNGTVSLP
jgi:hypothetical protein